MLLGAHESISGGWHKAFGFAAEDGCESIQIFTKNQNQWREPMPGDGDVETWKQAWTGSKVRGVLSHDSYLVNLGSPDEVLFEKSWQALVTELERCNRLGIPFVVIHPGSHVGQGEEVGLGRVAQGLSEVHARTPADGCRIALETTAGQGTNLGHRFEHLAELIKKTKAGDRLCVCYDTCHTYAAGYDITTQAAYEKIWKEFERVLGLERLVAFHLNDSRKGLGSRVDRHERMGEGTMGLEPFRLLVNDRRFAETIAVLETPPVDKSDRGYQKGLKTLRSLIGKKRIA